MWHFDWEAFVIFLVEKAPIVELVRLSGAKTDQLKWFSVDGFKVKCLHYCKNHAENRIIVGRGKAQATVHASKLPIDLLLMCIVWSYHNGSQ